MNMTESCLFANWRGVYDECPSFDGFSSYDASCPSNGKEFMMGVHHMMRVHHMMGIHHAYIACPFPFLQSECKNLAPFGKEV